MSLKILGGDLKGRVLKTPKGDTTRPTQGMLRGALFNIVQNEIKGAHFLDLFAGSGAMGLEAISRGAKHSTLIEKNPLALAAIRENIIFLHIEEKITLFPMDVIRGLKKLEGPFDLIYIDPPYDTPTRPILEELLTRKLLSPLSQLFVEERLISHQKPHRFDLPRLFQKETRRFGSTLLHHYQFSDQSE